MANMTTASDYRNPNSSVDTDDRALRNGPQYIIESLEDDATYNLGTLVQGAFAVQYGANLGLFASSGSAVAIITDGGSIFDDADTDTKMCLYVSSGELILKNRTGSTVNNIRVLRIM